MPECEIYTDCLKDSGQNVHYYRLGTCAGRRYKVEIKTDPYQLSNNQGYARIDIWDGNRWNEVLIIPGALMSSPPNLAYKRDPDIFMEGIEADILRLENALRWVVDDRRSMR